MVSTIKIPLLISLPLCFSGCLVNMDLYVEDHPPLTEIRKVGHYSRVEVSAPVPVILKKGYSPSVTVTTAENRMRYLDTYTVGSTLYIEWNSAFQPGAETEVVCILPELKGIVHNRNSTLYVEAFPGTHRFDIEVNGAGDLHFGGDLLELNARLNGSGDLYLDGDVDYLDVILSGSGDLIADALWVHRNANVTMVGNGDAYLALQGGSRLDAKVGGSGSLEWWGLPAVTRYDLSGTGKVIEHRQPLYKKSGSSRPLSTKKE